MDYNKDDIQRYRDGSLTGAERNALEKKALNDPFLADALEGAETVTPEQLSSDLLDLAQRIRKEDDAFRFTSLRIAAGVALLVGVGSLLYWINRPDPMQLAVAEAVTADSLAKRESDSITSSLLALEKARAEEKAISKDEAKSEQRIAASDYKSKEVKPDSRSKANVEPANQIADLQPAASEPTITSGREADDQSKDEMQKEKVAEGEVEAAGLANDKAPQLKKSAASAGPQLKKDDDQRALAIPTEDRSVSPGSPQQNIVGQVTSMDDGSPLPGVNVVVKGTNQGTVTDANGNYSLPGQGNTLVLEFSFIGMKTVDAAVNNNLKNDIRMTQDATQLSEVVITGESVQSNSLDGALEPIVRLAEPKGGMRAYNKYLENSLKMPSQAAANKVKGKVTIGFTVTTQGELTDFNVIRSLGYGCDEEVIRLVKEGPAWSPSTRDDVAVESEVKVRLKFDSEKGRE
jgi:TonB family protein